MMENFYDEASCQKPGHLFSNSLSSLLVEPTEVLFHQFVLRIHIKGVLSESPRYTWHVRGIPCKDVPILTDELDERTFLFRIQIGTDAELLGRITSHKVNKLSLSCRCKLQGRIMLRSRLL